MVIPDRNGAERTQSTESGKSRIWQSPCAGGGGEAGWSQSMKKRSCEHISYRPEVVDENVEHTQQHNQNDGTPLGLETNDDHNAGN